MLEHQVRRNIAGTSRSGGKHDCHLVFWEFAGSYCTQQCNCYKDAPVQPQDALHFRDFQITKEAIWRLPGLSQELLRDM